MSHSRTLSQVGSGLLRGHRSSRRLPLARPAAAAAVTTVPHASQYHFSAPARMAYKDDQNRESVKPRSQEYVKSDSKGDDAAAHEDSAAFDPNKTRPKTEKAAADKDSSTLDFSPANTEVSAGTTGKQNKASGQQKQKSSGAGGIKK